MDLWTPIVAWEGWGRLIGIAIVLVVAVLLRFVLHFVIRRVVRRVVNGAKKREGAADTQVLITSPLAAVRVVQRTQTLGSVLSNIVTAAILIVTVLMVVTIAFPGITGSFALITAALGAGLGFGAQNIVKDVLNGLFMVSEDQLGIGDVVDLGFATGVVEHVGVRITQVRDVNGTLWYVRNGEVLRVGAADRLLVRHPRLAGAVAREAALACGDGAEGGLPSGPVSVGAESWQVTAIGLRQDLRGVLGMARLLAPEHLALVVLRRISAERGREPDHLAELGLSPAESRLAQLMDGSRSLVQAAESLGIRHETARSQLRQVFAKLGVSRQSELAVFILRLRQRA